MRLLNILIRRFKSVDSRYYLAFVFLFDLLYKFIVLLPYIQISTFLIRDVNRAKVILEKGMVYFGPDTTSGYYLPGPFYSLLLTPVISITEDIKWIVFYHFLLNSFCYLRLSLVIGRTYRIAPWVTFLLCSSTPFMVFKIFWVNNSTLIPGIVALFLAQTFLFFKEKKILHLYIIGLIVGLGVQIHGSLLMLIFSFSILVSFLKPRIVSSKFKICLHVWLAFLIPLLPFLVRIQFSSTPFHRMYTHDNFLFERLIHKFQLLKISDYLVFEPFRVELLIVYLLSFGIIFKYTIWEIRKQSDNTKIEFKKYLVVLFPLFIYFFNILFAPTTPRYGFFLVFIAKILCLVILFENKFWNFFARLIAIILFISMASSLVDYKTNKAFGKKYYTSHNDLTLKDSKQICEYLTKNGVTQFYFTRNTYEILDKNQEDGLWLLKSCLPKEEVNLLKSDLFYIFVARSIAEDPERFEKETQSIREVVPEFTLLNRNEPDLDTDNFLLYEVKKQSKDFVGNLTDPYIIDPAIQANFPIWSGLGDEIGIENFDFKKFSLCEANYFCDLLVFYKTVGGWIRFSSFSRLFQSRWGTPPGSAFTSEMRLNYDCDGESVSYQWPMSIGSVYKAEGLLPTEQNLTNYMPAYLDLKTNCKSLKLRSLVLKDVTFRLKGGFKKSDTIVFDF